MTYLSYDYNALPFVIITSFV